MTWLRETADISRAALAFLRAVRDRNWEDSKVILGGIRISQRKQFAYSLALHATSDGLLTDEVLNRNLAYVNQLEVSGELLNRVQRTSD